MKGVINDKKIDMISKFYNLYAQMLLSEANIFLPRCVQCRRGQAMKILCVRVTRTALRRCVRRLDFDHHVSIDGHGVSDRGSQSASCVRCC